VVSGRVGGHWRRTRIDEGHRQIDAIEASAVDPHKYLVATRVLACIAMLPLLTLVADCCGILMGWVADTLAEPISLRLFLNTGSNGVTFNDFLPPTLKTAVFGLIIGLVSCFQDADARRNRGGRQSYHQRGGSVVALYHSCRCPAGAVHHCIFSMKVYGGRKQFRAGRSRHLTKLFGS
jgi:ABC-type multidrug transport system fused ATPase/permease subunit